MRTWGRITVSEQSSAIGEFVIGESAIGGSKQWVEVTPDVNGDESYIWLTTLIQCLKLSIGESPFHADYGIPAQRSVIQQLFPDFYVNQTQGQFAQYFASLSVQKVANAQPTYKINALLNNGATVQIQVAT